MKQLIYFSIFIVSLFAPRPTFAIISHGETVSIAAQKHAAIEKKKIKKSTATTLILSVGFLGLAYLAKIAGLSVGIIAGCYIAALVCAILCIGSLMKK